MLPRGVPPLKYSTIDLMRVWAAITGLFLTLAFFVMVYLGRGNPDQVVLLTVAIAGFELFFFVQDIAQRFRRRA
jgi:hypothetical protein